MGFFSDTEATSNLHLILYKVKKILTIKCRSPTITPRMVLMKKKTTDHKIKLLNKNHNERIKNVHAKYVNTHVRQGVLMIMFESDKLYF